MSFAAIRSQNRSQEWNLGAAKLRQSIRFAIIGPKTANFGPKVVFLVIFGQILVFLAHWAPCLTKKEKPRWVSLWWSTKTFPTDRHNCDSWPTDGRFCLKIAIFGLFSDYFWPWWLICCHVCHKNKQEYSALVVFYYWSTKLLLISLEIELVGQKWLFMPILAKNICTKSPFLITKVFNCLSGQLMVTVTKGEEDLHQTQ